MDNVKRMDIAEFREFGYLQELNRIFLHPLGLAVEVVVEEDGTERLGGVWDYRDNPEGLHYGDGVDPEKASRVMREQADRGRVRCETLGYWHQPVGE